MEDLSSPETPAFTDALRKVLSVSKEEMSQRLAAEKKAKASLERRAPVSSVGVVPFPAQS